MPSAVPVVSYELERPERPYIPLFFSLLPNFYDGVKLLVEHEHVGGGRCYDTVRSITIE